MYYPRTPRGGTAALRVALACALRLALAYALLCLVAPARAQQSPTTAALTGRVEDARGAAVVAATVTATRVETNQSRQTRTDSEGRYRFAFLPVGAYRVTVESEGFATLTKELTLTVGESLDAPLRVEVGGVAASVAVTDDLPVVESARTQVSGTVRPGEIASLPLNGRNYLDLALLVPGVSRTNTGTPQRFAETSAVPGTGLSVAGQRNLNNGFVVDGLSANDDAADLAGTFYSQEVIREFAVVTSGAGAEYGRASAGVVQVVTQSGTNDWRGRLYGFLRNQRLDARNPLAASKDPLTQGQYGLSLGGPVVRDRTFLFTNFEQTRRHDAGVVTIDPAQVSAINRRLDAVGYGGARLSTGEFAGGYVTSNFFARLDRQVGAQQLAARYSLYHIDGTNGRGAGGLNAVSRGSNLRDTDQTLALSDVATLSGKTVNEARFQFTRSRLAAPINDSTGPAVNISGVANFGTATTSPLARDADLFELVDNVTTLRAGHTFKAGADVLYNRVNILFPGALQGVYTFSSAANFLAGRYTTYQQAFGEPAQRQSNPNFGLFAQDEWRPTAGLTVNAGLRYEAQLLPSPIRRDLDNFAPRLGVAYAPRDRKTVVRAAFGVYYDRIPLRATANALQRDGVRYRVAVLSFGQPGAPAFPNTLAAFPAGLLTSITAIDPNIENSYGIQAHAQVERELRGGFALSVGYQHLRGEHLILQRNVNAPTLSAAEAAARGVANLGRPDPRFANVSRYESSGDSYYDSMTAAIERRAGRWSSLRVSYTLSKSIDDAGNFFFSTPQDNSNLRAERALSDNDQRHRLNLSGSLETPRAGREASRGRRALDGWRLSYLFSYASALPFNVQTGTDRNFDTNSNDRPAGVGRNTGRGFDYASLDLRLSRRLKVTERLRAELIAETFNLLNRANYQVPNNVFGPGATPLATFGRPTAAADPRQCQFGFKLDF